MKPTTRKPETAAAHTPTPWAIHERDKTTVACCRNGIAIADCHIFVSESPAMDLEREANARLIVRAVNSHQALVDACKIALESSEGEHGGGWTHVNDALRAALALAEVSE